MREGAGAPETGLRVVTRSLSLGPEEAASELGGRALPRACPPQAVLQRGALAEEGPGAPRLLGTASLPCDKTSVEAKDLLLKSVTPCVLGADGLGAEVSGRTAK